MPKKTFKQWLNEVHRHLDFVGLSLFDLPDCPYQDWFEDGASPKVAAKKAIRNAFGD